MAHSWIAKLLDEVFSLRASWSEEICKIVPVFCNNCVVYLGKVGYKVRRHRCGTSAVERDQVTGSIMFAAILQQPRLECDSSDGR